MAALLPQHPTTRLLSSKTSICQVIIENDYSDSFPFLPSNTFGSIAVKSKVDKESGGAGHSRTSQPCDLHHCSPLKALPSRSVGRQEAVSTPPGSVESPRSRWAPCRPRCVAGSASSPVTRPPRAHQKIFIITPHLSAGEAFLEIHSQLLSRVLQEELSKANYTIRSIAPFLTQP